MYETLNKINSPKDVKAMNIDELKLLAEDIREALFNRLTKYGGHFGPNFGMVEMEIALHYVFNSPEDKFVFDVSHQSYPHKMLTGRRLGYTDENHFHEDSGFTNPDESDHDFFNIGHTSTAVSLASGLAKARDLKNGNENIIAIVGDGSLSGGQAFEGLNFVGSDLNSNFIIVVNDNEQSIAENHGGLYKNLQELRETQGKASTNYFKALGLDYLYEENGNDIEALIALFEKVKDIDHLIVLHVHTQKGKGYQLAEENREAWHWSNPFDRETGLPLNKSNKESYKTIIVDFLKEKAKENKDFVVITPAMPNVIGLSIEERAQLGNQYVDVGIAEEQAIAMASGISKRGGHPLVFTNASFMQRAYDQLSQDLCINNNPVTILLNDASFYVARDVTHLGIFAITAFANIPNLVILSPTSKKEYLAMANWSVKQKEHPVMILTPGNGVIDDHRDVDTEFKLNTFKVEEKGSKVAILALGDFYQRGEEISSLVEERLGFKPTLVNPRFANGIDKETLDSLKENHELVVTLEDGVLEGGFGERVASYYGPFDMKVKNYGLNKEFYDRYDPQDVLKSLNADNESIVKFIDEILK